MNFSNIKSFSIILLMASHLGAIAAELKWTEPFEAAKQEAKQSGKAMLVFVGNTDACKDCQMFVDSVCTSQELSDFAATNLICTRVLSGKDDTKDENWNRSRIVESFNIPSSHAVIIANSNGVRIGELSTAPESIAAFIQDIKTIIAKSVPEGRLKYSEVSMIDQTFVPEKTYKTELPTFSPKPLTGRYINLMTAVRLQSWENTRTRTHGQNNEPQKHTPEIALKMRKSLAEVFPEARITWAWSWGALRDKRENYVGLRKLMAQFVKEYGDEMTFWPGVDFANKFNTQEQCKKDLHEGLDLVSQMVGNGYRPKSVIAGHMSVESMKFLADNEGIHTVQGQIWSQFQIDGQDGDGGIIYPYYSSKDHFLKPAQAPRGSGDFVDMVNIDGWTVDFFAARLRGMGKDGNSRMGIGPIETNAYYGTKLGLKQLMHTSDVHFNDQAVARNGYGFLTVIWELTLFQWLDPDYLPSWIKAMREKYPDTQMMTTGEFGDLWRKHNPDNSRINLKFVERGADMPSEEEGKKITPKYHFYPLIACPEKEIRWYFNKDFRLATLQDWKNHGPVLVMDYTRYNQPYKEPNGNVNERHWDILDVINQKESRPQDKPKPFTDLPLQEQANILKWYPELQGQLPGASKCPLQPTVEEKTLKFPDQSELMTLLPTAMVGHADHTRIIGVMQKALQGKALTIMGIGTSIMAGANASDFQKTSLSPLIYDWWVKKFPKAKFNFINAGMGASSAVYAVHRAERDILIHNPDFTVIDYTASDRNFEAEGYEGLIRKMLIQRPQSALLSIIQGGQNSVKVPDVHVAINENYGIPMLSVPQVFIPLLKSGRISWADWSKDTIHPSESGHRMIADLVISDLEKCYDEAVKLHEPVSIDALKSPVTKNGFAKSAVCDASSFTPENLGNWTHYRDRTVWNHSWTASAEGPPMVVKINAKSLIFGYRKTIHPTHGKLIVKMDGQQIKEIDPNFMNGWGDWVPNETVFKSNLAEHHTIEFIYNGSPGEPIFITYLLIAE